MELSAEFSQRIFRTRISCIFTNFKRLDQIVKDWSGSEIDIIEENLQPIVIIIFKTAEDCLAFTLRYYNTNI